MSTRKHKQTDTTPMFPSIVAETHEFNQYWETLKAIAGRGFDQIMVESHRLVLIHLDGIKPCCARAVSTLKG